MLMDESMFRFLIDCKTEQEKNRVISTSMVIILIGGILFGVVAYPVLKIVRYQYAFFLIAYVISSVVSAMMNALLRGIGRTAQYAICNFLTSVLKWQCYILRATTVNITRYLTNSVQLFRICFTIIMTAEKVYLKDMRSVYSIFLKTYRVLIM